jgi:hypothetical protein
MTTECQHGHAFDRTCVACGRTPSRGHAGSKYRYTENEVLRFGTSKEAWAFMCECDAKGIQAGYPEHHKVDYDGEIVRWYTVETKGES